MSTEIVTRLKALKLHGMASNWPELVAHCRHAALEPEQLIEQLLDAEGAERNVRSIAYQMTAARFPAHRDLASFDFEASAVDETLVRKLHTAQFTEAAHNVVLIGGPGTGKTHLATALGIEAIQQHSKRVRFQSTVELVNALEAEKAAGKAGRGWLSHHGFHGFVHVLHAHIFMFAMQGHFTGKQVRTGQAHETQPGAVCAATDAFFPGGAAGSQ